MKGLLGGDAVATISKTVALIELEAPAPNTCPVCGFDGLDTPPASWTICPCCLTEFGSSDASWSHEELRQEWLASGARWLGDVADRPKHWSSVEQLRKLGYESAAQSPNKAQAKDETAES
jgi:hypothetical protein